MTNLAAPTQASTYLLARPIAQTQNRLDALLMVLKSCSASSCTDPWSVVHPKGGVVNLRDAMDAKYDAFYESQPKVAFSKCEPGHIVSSEGPQEGIAYGGMNSWPQWT